MKEARTFILMSYISLRIARSDPKNVSRGLAPSADWLCHYNLM